MTSTGIKQTTGAPATAVPMKWDTFLLQELNIVSTLEQDQTKPIPMGFNAVLKRFGYDDTNRVPYNNEQPYKFGVSDINVLAGQLVAEGTPEAIQLAQQFDECRKSLLKVITNYAKHKNIIPNVEWVE